MEDMEKETVKEEVSNKKSETTVNEEKTSKEKKTKKNKFEVENEKLKAEIESLKKKNKEEGEEYLKARAELDNIRKRLVEEANQTKKFACQNLVGEIITPLDMLFKIVDFKSDNQEVNNYVLGFKMITDQIKSILEKDGLKEIKALNEKFDPNFHQAMSKEKRDGVEPGIVIEVLQQGYMYKDRLLRPAMVKVSE